MKMTYDHTADALYLELTDKQRISTKRINDSVMLDLDESGQVVGIEVLNTQKLGINPFTFSLEHLPIGHDIEPPNADDIKARRAVIIEARKRKQQAKQS